MWLPDLLLGLLFPWGSSRHGYDGRLSPRSSAGTGFFLLAPPNRFQATIRWMRASTLTSILRPFDLQVFEAETSNQLDYLALSPGNVAPVNSGALTVGENATVGAIDGAIVGAKLGARLDSSVNVGAKFGAIVAERAIGIAISAALAGMAAERPPADATTTLTASIILRDCNCIVFSVESCMGRSVDDPKTVRKES